VTPNPHIVEAEQLRKLSGKRTASAVRKWASARGIRTLDGDDGPFTSIEAVNRAGALAARNAGEPWEEEGITAWEWLERNYERFLYSPSHICSAASPYPSRHKGATRRDPSGIYFLLSDGKIFYVGLSIHVFARIDQHRNEGMTFTHFWYFKAPKLLLSEIELFYIHAFEPPLNIKYPPLNDPALRYVEKHKAMK
jgi:hypothetical protein